MATHSSAKKAHKQSEHRYARNKSVRSLMRNQVRKAERLIADDQVAEAETAVLTAVRILDRAAKKGIIHSNHAARSKSRLVVKYNTAKAK